MPKRTHRIVIRCLCLLLLILAPQTARTDEGPLAGLDDYIQDALGDWEVPGIAVAIVKDDEVLLAKGYGLRELGTDDMVDERTLFAIGSCSKAFTAASLAMLVDEKKLDWNDHVTKHLAGFELFDPYVTREISVRDLLCHRSGLSRGDRLWYGTPYDRDEVLRRVRYLEPSWSFRSRFGYQNIMFLAAGQIIPAVTGKSWDQFVDERIFTPLGMDESNTSIADLEGHDNVATPHRRIDETLLPIRYRNLDNIAPAGSINSNVSEMTGWLRLQLGEGQYEGKQLVSTASIREMHTPHTIVPFGEQNQKLNPSTHFNAYGLGWGLRDYRGRKLVSHGGGIDGMISTVRLVPEESLGVVVLSNRDGQNLPGALAMKVIDRFLKSPEPDRDWSAVMLSLFKQQQQQAETERRKREESRAKDTAPSLELDDYAGTYEHEMYGQATVTLEDGKLVIRIGPNFTGDMEHWHHDTFRIKWRYEADPPTFVTFTLDAEGKIAAADFEGLDEFERKEKESQDEEN